MSGPGRSVVPAILLALLVALATGCATIPGGAERTALASLDASGPTPPPASPSPYTICDTSLAPLPSLPRPGHMPGGALQSIQRRGYLRVGVDLNSLLLSYQDPRSGSFQGFEIDLVQRIAKAIFGDVRGRIRYVALTTAQRTTAVGTRTRPGAVDMVVDAVTMTCRRAAARAFSAPYFVARQKLLVPADSAVRGIGDLRGKRICATAGSTSSGIIQPAGARFVPVQTRIDCLVLLQEHRVDAVTSDDAILAGLQAQDPTTKIVPLNAPAAIQPPPGPYGVEIRRDPRHRQLVRFVNAVLERMRTAGTWVRLYDKWLEPSLGPGHQPQPTYGSLG